MVSFSTHLFAPSLYQAPSHPRSSGPSPGHLCRDTFLRSGRSSLLCTGTLASRNPQEDRGRPLALFAKGSCEGQGSLWALLCWQLWARKKSLAGGGFSCSVPSKAGGVSFLAQFEKSVGCRPKSEQTSQPRVWAFSLPP